MTIEERKKHVEQLLDQGMKPHDIHKAYGYNEQSIYNWFPALAKQNNKTVKDKTVSEILKLRKQGMNGKEIATSLGMSVYTVYEICRNSGVRCRTGHSGETFCEAYVDLERFEYIGGYKNDESVIKLKCKKCGAVEEYSCQSLRKNNRLLKETKCKNCVREEKEAKRTADRLIKEAEKKRLREEQKQKAEAERNEKKLQKRRVIYCCECGKQFITNITAQKFCSKECSKKNHNRIQTIKKQTRIPKERLIDKDISLRSLYERDKGFCHICGMHCDMELDTNDNFYPSIDHVIPLVKGGLHSWGNVMLAHRVCNSSKGAR